AAAQTLFDTGDAHGAKHLLTETEDLDAQQHPKVIELLERIESVISAQEAALAAEQQRQSAKRASLRAAIGNARRRFENRKYQAAIELLESLDPASNSEVADTLRELRGKLQQIEEQQKAEEGKSPESQETRVFLLPGETAQRQSRTVRNDPR